jgi:hypothetical protein
MNDQANGATAEIPIPEKDNVLAALDALRSAYVAGEIEAIAFCAAKPGGETGPAGWTGKDGQWGATLGYSIHLLGFRYDAMICAAGVPNAPMMSEVTDDQPEDDQTNRDHGLG